MTRPTKTGTARCLDRYLQVRKSRQADRGFTVSWPGLALPVTGARGATDPQASVQTAPGAQVSEKLDRQRVPQSESRSHSMLLERPTWNEQREPSSQRRLALSPVLSMQLEFSSQCTEQEGRQLPLQLLSGGHSRLQLLDLQGPPVNPQVSVAQFRGAPSQRPPERRPRSSGHRTAGCWNSSPRDRGPQDQRQHRLGVGHGVC